MMSVWEFYVSFSDALDHLFKAFVCLIVEMMCSETLSLG